MIDEIGWAWVVYVRHYTVATARQFNLLPSTPSATWIVNWHLDRALEEVERL